ncbi:SMC-Scp complex subunit ScpB [Halobacteriovorax sp. GB3]|uniref:SMC-Scp complex subunit ScpB n=1 Tax=Halobacteriovorax sp. GB3 TaxID=2719615 RepID=UPI002360A52D|nr:SMC-Scp complex subunit ScpB [Halobacteriovorax sp. GB3]MDD0852585.1 SMC-Scp complex subunit ScpB [Halobacteriovorax sp. GB3]
MDEINSTENENLELEIEQDQENEEVSFPVESDLEFPDVEALMAKVEDDFSDYSGESNNDEQFNLELNYLDDKKQEDKIWQARTGLNYDTLCGAIETVIFMSDKPVALAKIKNLIDEDIPLRVIHESLTRLQDEYESSHHGLRLAEVAEGYQFRTKATYSKYVQDLFKVNELVLSPTALEVLAIISYKQPVSKVEVEKIRGVDSSHIVRGLIDKRLVKVCGRSDEVGKPVLYGTTPEFLEVFNLANLDQLPPEHELEEMATAGVGSISDIKTIVHDGDKSRFTFDEIEELDELADSIKSISPETDFTRSLKVEEKKRKTEAGAEVKSAFDLLEEFVNSSQAARFNEQAVVSELFTAVIDPKVISDLTAGPFNEPEVFDDEDFQMIDLDTGEPIPMDDIEFDVEVELEMSDDDESVSKEEEKEEIPGDDITDLAMLAALGAEQSDELDSYIGDEPSEVAEVEEKAEVSKEDSAMELEAENLFKEDKDEIKSLAAALDNAFAKLTGHNLDDESDLEDGHREADELGADLDDLSSDIVSKGNDLDLDLSFLKNGEKSSEDSIDFD